MVPATVVSDLFPGVNLGDWTAGAFVALVILMILTDRLVTRGRLLDERAEKEIWRLKAERESDINAANADTLKNFAQAALEDARAEEQRKHPPRESG